MLEILAHVLGTTATGCAAYGTTARNWLNTRDVEALFGASTRFTRVGITCGCWKWAQQLGAGLCLLPVLGCRGSSVACDTSLKMTPNRYWGGQLPTIAHSCCRGMKPGYAEDDPIARPKHSWDTDTTGIFFRAGSRSRSGPITQQRSPPRNDHHETRWGLEPRRIMSR